MRVRAAWTECRLRGKTRGGKRPESRYFEPTITNEGRPAHGHFYELNSSLDFGTWTSLRTLLSEILQTKSSLPHSQSKLCPSLLITRSWLSLAGFSCHIVSGRHLALAATMGLSSHCFSCLNTHNGSCVCVRESERQVNMPEIQSLWCFIHYTVSMNNR